ncbi:amino acid decarboxylase [Candidatus Acetothermia bacterium]|nr:amino acid decarboxylase [Candidatus Acetothermia bacterium]MBI3644134.1 amino acid decarboxylase [Candidatus Acetothermia bacterium]
MRKLGHRMVDEMMTYLETVRERPIWQPMPDDVQQFFKEPLPQKPQAPESIYEEFLKNVPPYNMGNVHPRFWGWVIGSGTPLGALADFLAATMNPNMGGGNHAGNLMEGQVINWSKEMLGFPKEASGLLVSGGSMANLVGLTVARNAKAKFNIREEGLQKAPHQMVFYSSNETHSSNIKAAELLGLGREALRLLPVNSEFEINLDALEEAIKRDKRSGHYPFCIIGNAGTVNTAATDDLNRLADICEREGLWFHVDGAFGALAALSPQLKKIVSGMERADSIAFDFHKWMYVPYEVGCALVRDKKAHYDAFSYVPTYLAKHERGVAAGPVWFSDYGIQLSRGFRALKVWMSLKEHGIEKYGRLIQQNVDQAHYLASLVRKEKGLELLAPVPLNIVCFRYASNKLSDQALNKLNQEILMRLHEEGIAVPSYTIIDKNYAIRVAITNHRSERSDFDLLVHEVLRLGKALQEKPA